MTATARWSGPFGRWEPAQPTEAAEIFSGMRCPWWIAGGHAIELAVGRPVREHGDIDVMVLRPDQLHVQRALQGWEWWAADPPGTLRPWRRHEYLRPGIHDIWCRPGPGQPWRIQVMIDESADGDWIPRRDPRIRRPIAEIGRTSSDGIPYLAPEIQLFYKAKNPRPKDQTDFTAVLPCLDQTQRRWLTSALARTFGEHPWQDRLAWPSQQPANIRPYIDAMTGEIEHPDIRHVVYPVHLDGSPTGAQPRLRHYQDCGHFEWPGGLRLGTPMLATDQQMRTLRACQTCVSSRGGSSGSSLADPRQGRTGGLCGSCSEVLPLDRTLR